MKERQPRSLRWLSSFITRMVRPLLMLMAKLKLSRVTVTGRENIRQLDEAFIVASNHISILDPVYTWGALRRNAAAIAMKELWSWPVIGTLVHLMGHIPVDRKDRASGIKAVEQGVRVLKAGGVVMIYPEGRISQSGELLPLKVGVYQLAKASGAKVVPAGITGSNLVKPAVARGISLRHPVKLAFGEALDPHDFSAADDFLAELARRISQLSN